MLTGAACEAPARPVAQGKIVVTGDVRWIVSAAAPVSIFNCMRARFRKLAHPRQQAVGNGQSGGLGRTAGFREPALVLRDGLLTLRSRRKAASRRGPPQDEGSERAAIFDCGYTR